MRASAEPSRFRAYVHDQCIAAVTLDTAAPEEVSATLSETQRLGFEVEPREDGEEYRILIGDQTPVDAIGKAFRRHIEWSSEQYLESARGLVRIKLFSRSEQLGDPGWRPRATLPVVVNSSKITEAVFESMVNDLTALSGGLLFDLLSKATAGLRQRAGRSTARVSPRSAQMELRFLERLVDELAATLIVIAEQPQTALRSERVIAAWTGSERLSADGLAWFLARGMNPREASVGHEMLGPRLQVVPETGSAEHGIIRWFLELLLQRAGECAQRASAERASLEADEPYRNRRFDGKPSLFEMFDQPKIARLVEAEKRAERVRRSIHGLLSLQFLARQRTIAPVEQTPVFRNVLHYHRFWRAMREYLRRTTVLLEHSVDERSKPTWRMYEQWVFLQIAAAFEHCGLQPSSHESLFRRLGTHLFTVDLRRGTKLGFTSGDGRVVLLRYEPWIFSRDLARSNGEAVFQGREGEAPWSPDVIIEVFETPSRERPLRLAAVIVVDAKYSRRLEEHHWSDTSKYQMIRETESASQIVRQVWVALPAEIDGASAFRFRDDSVSWTRDGPDRPFSASEFLQGAVSMAPDPKRSQGAVCESALEFVRGNLTWLGFREGERPADGEQYSWAG